MGWRDEITTALNEWIALEGGTGRGEQWRRIGAAQATAEPGVFVVDIRGSELNADQFDKLRLAGANEDSVTSGFPAMEATVEGQLLRVRVAEFAQPADPHVWRLQQPRTFLLTSLRDGIVRLNNAGLANLLARGEIGGTPASLPAPVGLLPGQVQAYRACLGTGVWLVWGPPGTGKTRLLQTAISDLIENGMRVLLVSATNIAVDNALLGVLKEGRHQPGQVVRVGPPQLREVAEDQNVSLPLLVRARLTELEEQRRSVATALVEMRRDEERLRHLDARLTRFDAAAYERAVARLHGPGQDAASLERALRECEQAAATGAGAVALAQRQADSAQAALDEALPAKQQWQDVEARLREVALVEEEATRAEAETLRADGDCARIEEEIGRLRRPSGRVRWRDRRRLSEYEARLADAKAVRDARRSHAEAARDTAERFRRDTERALREVIARIPFSDSADGDLGAT